MPVAAPAAPTAPTLLARALKLCARGDALVDDAAGWIARRAIDIAPGVGLGVLVSRTMGVDVRVAVPVGAAASQAIAVASHYILRDRTQAPDARRARRAFARIVAAAERGVPRPEILADLRTAGWSEDQAHRLAAVLLGKDNDAKSVRTAGG